MADSESEATFGFLTRRIGPLPLWVWAVIIIAVYYWYTHFGPGAATGTTASGNVTETLNTSQGPVTINTTRKSSGNSREPVTQGHEIKPVSHPAARVVRKPNHKPHRASEPRTVTVAKWPGKTSNGRAQWNTTLWGISKHEHVSLGSLEKDNPQIKNPNLVYPGEKIRIP